MKIRKASMEDASKISQLIHSVLNNSNAPDYPDQVIQFMRMYYSTSNIKEKILQNDCWVYEEYCTDTSKIEIVGTVSLRANELQGLFIDNAFQGQGIGKALVEFAEIHAKEKSIRTLCLSASVTARRFYERLGYKCLKTMDDSSFGRAFLMEKAL